MSNTSLFGNVAVLMVGDPMQLKPVKAQYPFCEPRNEANKQRHHIEPLFDQFTPMPLVTNHRQQEDQEFCQLLERMRFGRHEIEGIPTLTLSDFEVLQSRVITDLSQAPSGFVFLYH